MTCRIARGKEIFSRLDIDLADDRRIEDLVEYLRAPIPFQVGPWSDRNGDYRGRIRCSCSGRLRHDRVPWASALLSNNAGIV